MHATEHPTRDSSVLSVGYEWKVSAIAAVRSDFEPRSSFRDNAIQSIKVAELEQCR